MTLTKYNLLFGYSLFFIILQLILVPYSVEVANDSEIIESEFGGDLEIPECSFGLIVIDGLLLCAFDFAELFFNLFVISSTFAVIQSVFIITFIIILALIVADLIRGSG